MAACEPAAQGDGPMSEHGRWEPDGEVLVRAIELQGQVLARHTEMLSAILRIVSEEPAEAEHDLAETLAGLAAALAGQQDVLSRLVVAVQELPERLAAALRGEAPAGLRWDN